MLTLKDLTELLEKDIEKYETGWREIHTLQLIVRELARIQIARTPEEVKEPDFEPNDRYSDCCLQTMPIMNFNDTWQCKCGQRWRKTARGLTTKNLYPS